MEELGSADCGTQSASRTSDPCHLWWAAELVIGFIYSIHRLIVG